MLANDTDADGGPKTVASVTQPANGTVVDNDTAERLTYTPDADYCNNPPGTAPDTFTYTLNGGDTATVSVTVTCAADAPVVDASAGATAYTENGPAAPIDPGVTVTDPDAGTQISGATVQITANFAAGQDVLALSGSHGRHHGGPQRGHADADGRREPRGVPGRAARRDVRQQLGDAVDARAHGRRSPSRTARRCPAPTRRASRSPRPTTRRSR